MFFVLSKTVAFLLLPSNFLILLGLVGLILLVTRFKRVGQGLMAASIVLLALAGFLPIGSMLGQVLESRFPPWDASRGPPDGIVVLGGGISANLSRDYGDTIVNADANRVFAIAKLARAYPNARIVYSGGDASLHGGGAVEAEFLSPMLDTFGLARDRVLLESRSRNTAENAAFSRDLVKPKPGERWLLVTSAQHMPRAVGCFRQTGFAVEAYPVAWRTSPRGNHSAGTVLGKGLDRLDAAVHEWLGLIAYRLTGKTGELLPSP